MSVVVVVGLRVTSVSGAPVGSGLVHRMADMRRDRLAGTVETALLDPTSQLRDVGDRRIINDVGCLGDGVRIDGPDTL